MTSDVYPLQVLLLALAGWVNRHQQQVIQLSFAKSVSDSRGDSPCSCDSGYVGREAAGNLRPFPAPPETVDVR
jgi:hypothetical protein